MTWTQTLPGLAAMTLLMVAPGWLMLRALGLRGLVALGPAATMTFAVGAGLAVVHDVVGIPWTLPTVLTGLAATVAVCAVLGHRLGTAPWVVGDWPTPRWARTRARNAYRSLLQPAALTRGQLLLAGGVLAVATGLYVLAMVRGIGVPDRPNQVWDGPFHLSAVQAVREHEVASSFGGLASLYDYGYEPFYPAGYHGIVAVSPLLDSVPAAVNGSLLVAGLLLPLSSMGLVRALWPQLPIAAALVPLTAHAFIGLPVALMTQLAQLPYAYAQVLLPGLLTLLVLAVRNLPLARATAVPALPAGVAAMGLALVHGSTWFSIVLLAAPLLLVVTVRALWQMRGSAGRYRAAGVAAWAAFGLGVLVALPLVGGDAVTAVRNFPRAGDEDYVWILTSLIVDRPLRSFRDHGLGGWPVVGQLLVVALAVAGAVLVWRLRSGRWLAVGLVTSVTLTALAFGPDDNPLRILAGYWYTEASRILALVVICAAPLAAVALAALARLATGQGLPGPMPRRMALTTGQGDPAAAAGQPGADDLPARPRARQPATARRADMHVARRRRREIVVAVALAAVVLVTTGGLRYSLKQQHAVQSYVPGHVAFRMLADDAELDLMRRAGDVLPDDAVVIGSRFRGTPYLYPVGGVDVVLPHLSGPRSADPAYLVHNFADIATDPEVCAALTRLGVTHFYTNTRTPGLAPWEQMLPSGTDAMYDFTPGDGFELVDSGGTGALYEITACDP